MYDVLNYTSALAGSSLFVLLSWCCGIYTVCIKTNPMFTDTQSFGVLVRIISILLDMLLDSDQNKPSMKTGAVARVRRALRVVSIPPSPLAQL